MKNRQQSPNPPIASSPDEPAKTGPTGIARLLAQPWWPWARRTATLLFFSLVVYLLFTQARQVQWREVVSVVQRYPGFLVTGALGLCAASLALYSCFDLLGRYYTGHRLSTPNVLTVTFISYVFNLNLGSLIGGIAFRYRMYSRLGLDYGLITRVLSLSMLTNWLGYLLLAGALFLFKPLPLPPHWSINSQGLQVLGAVLILLGATYLLLCMFSRQRVLSLRGREFELPSGGLAALQALMGAANWLLISSVIFVLLQQRIAYPTVVSILLIAAMAGVITHVPAGLGVLEAVFVALLSHQLPRHELLAALMTYRALYYLAPLGVATVLYLVTEARAKKLSAQAPQTQPESELHRANA